MYSFSKKPTHRDGSIIILVLAILALCGMILVAYMEDAANKIRHYGLQYNRDDLRLHAYSAMEVTLSVMSEMAELENGLYSSSQGFSDPLGYAGLPFPPEVELSVQIEDESGKFSLSRLAQDREIFREVLQEMGADLREIDRLVGTLADWIDENDDSNINGADGDYYQRENPPYYPPNRMVRNWDEFRLIDTWKKYFYDEQGRETELFRTFRSSVSLYHEDKTNLNSVNPAALEILEKIESIDVQGLERLKLGRDGIAGTADDGYLTPENQEQYFPSDSPILGIESSLFKVSVTAKMGDGVFLLTALVRHEGASTQGRQDNSGPSVGVRTDATGRGTVTQTSDRGQSLGYPFTIVRLVENQRI